MASDPAGNGISTTDQALSIQQTALKAAGCKVIRAEKRSGTTTAGREELKTVLDFPRDRHETVVNAFEDGVLEQFAERLRSSRSNSRSEKVLAQIAAQVRAGAAA